MVQAHIEGRLFGAKILKVDADLVLIPAQARRYARAAVLGRLPAAVSAPQPQLVELTHARQLLADADVTIRQTAT